MPRLPRHALSRAALASSVPKQRPWPLAAAIAIAWAVSIGLLISLALTAMVWAASADSGDVPALGRLSLLSWVVAHDVPVQIGKATYSLLPWGLLAIWALLLGHASSWVARSSRVTSVRTIGAIASVIAVPYSLLVALGAWVVSAGEVRVSPVRAFGIAVVVALLSCAIGAVRGAQIGGAVMARLPDEFRTMLKVSVVALATLLGLSSVLLAGSLVLNFGAALDMQYALGAGAVGGFVLLVISLGYLPVAVVWTASYALGAGLSLGRDTAISPFVNAPLAADLPPLPLLAALPSGSSVAAWALPIIGVGSGVVLGRFIAKGRFTALTRAALAIGAALLAAFVMAVLARLSTGSLGATELVRLGPPSQLVGSLTAITLLIGAVPAALVARRRGPRVRRRPDHLAVVPATAPEDSPTEDSAPADSAPDELASAQASPQAAGEEPIGAH